MQALAAYFLTLGANIYMGGIAVLVIFYLFSGKGKGLADLSHRVEVVSFLASEHGGTT